jgi:hypothetical protein
LIDLSGLQDDAAEGIVFHACLDVGDKLIDAEVQRFLGDVAAQDAGPIIAAPRRQLLDICSERLGDLPARGASHEQLVLAAHRITGKLLHAPIAAARDAAATGDVATLMVLCEILGLRATPEATALVGTALGVWRRAATSLATETASADDQPVERQRRELSPWWQMISGMRAYGVAITVIWAMCACTVLLVLAVATSGTWLHLGFAAGAVLELALSALTLRFLRRASVHGRFDV